MARGRRLSPALLLWHCTASPPQAPRGEAFLYCRSMPKGRAMGQEDLVATDDTDCLLRRCLCHPYAHEACACLYASDIRPRRLSCSRRYAFQADPRKPLSFIAVYVSLRLQACPLRTSPFLSDVLRVHPAKASTSPCPMARPFMHLTPRSQSPPRATARIVPCLCALRSALSTASPPHEVNKEQADTALRAASACTLVAVPHAVKSAEVRAATHECNIAHPQPKVCIIAHPACIFRKIAEGRANSLHRTDGRSSYAKRGKIPL